MKREKVPPAKSHDLYNGWNKSEQNTTLKFENCSSQSTESSHAGAISRVRLENWSRTGAGLGATDGPHAAQVPLSPSLDVDAGVSHWDGQAFKETHMCFVCVQLCQTDFGSTAVTFPTVLKTQSACNKNVRRSGSWRIYSTLPRSWRSRRNPLIHFVVVVQRWSPLCLIIMWKSKLLIPSLFCFYYSL